MEDTWRVCPEARNGPQRKGDEGVRGGVAKILITVLSSSVNTCSDIAHGEQGEMQLVVWPFLDLCFCVHHDLQSL